MSDGSSELQAALYDALATSSPAIAGGRIHDDVPEDVVFPYVQIGASDADLDDVDCSEGLDENITLHVWSRYRGMKEAKDIIAQIRTVLNAVSLTVSGRASAHSWVRQSRVVLDPDGVTRHGIVSVRVVHHA